VNGVERRHAGRREPVAGEPLATIRLRTGRECLVVNISSRGALVEGPRLLPGACVHMHVTTGGGRSLVRSRVLRCEVSRLTADAIWYRSGIAFEQGVDAHLNGYHVPAGEEDANGGPGSQYPAAGTVSPRPL